ncbi:MAG: N-methylhydantoinase [Desulfonauticus sp.]|nr:N-methylhydantoinase [Desulfonauticus sp.]
MIIIGVDTGGTFTDFIYREGKEWKVYKTLSTPANPAQAVLDGIEVIAGKKRVNITHGSTVATNALLERKGATTALITNRGFEDIIEIGRQNRKSLYNLQYKKEPPLVVRDNRLGIKGRIDFTGSILEELDEAEVEEVIETLQQTDVESVAVCLLFSFKNNLHERILGEKLEKSGFFYSLSSEVLSEFREYERLSTTVINAYVSPKMSRYLSFIEENLGESKLRIMQSNGGSISAGTARRESVRTILSGPAGGAVGAYELGRLAGFERLITFDMGGTSTDVCLIDGKLPLTMEAEITGLPLKTPMIDIHTVGAGGGSIAHLDVGGSLRVGPESAGADPGPICYGKGERITVTDANLFLGRLIPEKFLGGNMTLARKRLTPFFEAMAKECGLTPVELAEGILSVANANMERAIRVISVERGYNPSEFTLFSFGGGGGMHAVFLAKLLNIPRVLVPKHPGILSAVGMLLADVLKDYSQTIMFCQESFALKDFEPYFQELEERAVIDLLEEGIAREDIFLERYVDMRYKGQSYEIMVPFKEGFVEEFHRLHEKNYGYASPDKLIEVVNVRLRGRGKLPKPEFKQKEKVGTSVDARAIYAKQEVIFNGLPVSTYVYERDKLLPGNKLLGPAIIVEYSSTIVVPPDCEVEVDEYENLLILVK